MRLCSRLKLSEEIEDLRRKWNSRSCLFRVFSVSLTFLHALYLFLFCFFSFNFPSIFVSFLLISFSFLVLFLFFILLRRIPMSTMTSQLLPPMNVIFSGRNSWWYFNDQSKIRVKTINGCGSFDSSYFFK